MTILNTHTYACVGPWKNDGTGCDNGGSGATLVAGGIVGLLLLGGLVIGLRSLFSPRPATEVAAGTTPSPPSRPLPQHPPASGRNGKKPGDLLVKVEVVVPTELTDEQKAALESLAAVTEPAPRIAVDG